MVTAEPSDLGHLHHATAGDGVNITRLRAVHFQRPMNSPLAIVVEVLGEYSTQVPFMEDDDVIEAVASNRPDQPLDVGTLPRGSGCFVQVPGENGETESPAATLTLAESVPVNSRRQIFF